MDPIDTRVMLDTVQHIEPEVVPKTPSETLSEHPLFSTLDIVHEGFLTFHQKVALSVQRAKAIVEAYGLTTYDIANLTQPFWDMHADPAGIMDTAAGTLVTIQVNLFAGTLVKYIKDHPALKLLLDDVLAFHVLAHYCLTEVDHGLDAINIETTATLLPDGSFELHTPHPGASKMMPPTAPCGIPAAGIVFAKLIIDSKDCGVHPFVLSFNDGAHMEPGVTSRLLPPREGSPPVYHSITSFSRVKLAPYALLGGPGIHLHEKIKMRENHLATIWRTSVGAIALGSAGIPTMERSAFIAARYSQRRLVGTQTPGKRIPILHFRTQHGPILTALSYALIYRHFWRVAIRAFGDENADLNVRMAWATVFKATVIHHALETTAALASRCGAQGLFAHNSISSGYSSLLGMQIAEGDVLGLCIRLASELLLGRYSLPKPVDPSSLLAQTETNLIQCSREILLSLGQGKHRSDEFNERILPRCEQIIRTIGHRIAYEAAISAGEDPMIINLYEASVLKTDPDSNQLGVDLEKMESAAIKKALPWLDIWLKKTGAERYSQVPILTKENWQAFVERLPTYDSSGLVASKL